MEVHVCLHPQQVFDSFHLNQYSTISLKHYLRFLVFIIELKLFIQVFLDLKHSIIIIPANKLNAESVISS